MFLILHLSSGHNGEVLVAPLLIFSNPGHEGVINKNGRNIFFKNKKDDVCFFFSGDDYIPGSSRISIAGTCMCIIRKCNLVSLLYAKKTQ